MVGSRRGAVRVAHLPGAVGSLARAGVADAAPARLCDGLEPASFLVAALAPAALRIGGEPARIAAVAARPRGALALLVLFHHAVSALGRRGRETREALTVDHFVERSAHLLLSVSRVELVDAVLLAIRVVHDATRNYANNESSGH